MARFLSQTLTLKSHVTSTPSLLTALRSRSSISDNSAQIIEIDLGEVDASGSNGTELDLIGGVRKLEDAIHGIVVRRSAPVWLPFRPGSSYWVPPRKKGYSRGLVELVGKLANPITDEEMMSLTTSRGWPCSSFFIESRGHDKGFTMHQTEESQKTSTVNSDEEA